MRILVTGAGGLLGRELQQLLRGDPQASIDLRSPTRPHDLVALSREELDVTDADAVRRAFDRHAPDAVLHCAAWTAVDRAEEEPREARRVNVGGATHVARAAAAAGAVMVYPSTDFVFDGEKDAPYLPDDPTGPLSVYGRTKLDGEEAVRAAGPEHLVVRTSWVYGGGGFVDAILARARAGEALRVVDDQVGRPTWARSLALLLFQLLEGGARGVWHVADAGAVSWYDFAGAILEAAGEEAELTRVSSAAYGAAARRPAWSVLDTEATEAFLGRPMTPWPRSLERYLGREGQDGDRAGPDA